MNFHLPPVHPPAHQRGHPLSFFLSSLFVLERHRPPLDSNFRLTPSGFKGGGLRQCFLRGGGGNSAIISRDLGMRLLFRDQCSPSGNYKGLFRSEGKRRWRRWWSNSSFSGRWRSKGGASFAMSEKYCTTTSMKTDEITCCSATINISRAFP